MINQTNLVQSGLLKLLHVYTQFHTCRMYNFTHTCRYGIFVNYLEYSILSVLTDRLMRTLNRMLNEDT